MFRKFTATGIIYMVVGSIFVIGTIIGLIAVFKVHGITHKRTHRTMILDRDTDICYDNRYEKEYRYDLKYGFINPYDHTGGKYYEYYGKNCGE
jgi:hypothetical protein